MAPLHLARIIAALMNSFIFNGGSWMIIAEGMDQTRNIVNIHIDKQSY